MKTKALRCGINLAVVFAVVSSGVQARAQTFRAIYSFTGGSSAYPGNVTPAQGRDGRLYGTADGFPGSPGSAFSVTTKGQFSQLYEFGGANGSAPGGSLTLASDGSFYGTTASGGAMGNGVLFKVTRDKVYTLLHSFAGGNEGSSPIAPPIQGVDGAFYGTTYGDTNTQSTIYRYTPAAGVSTLYQFTSDHGAEVIAPLIQASDGSLYGTAYQGGANGCGTLFQISTAGKVLWYHSLTCDAGGANPSAPLIQTSDGTLYGTTLAGGIGFGTVFKIAKQNVVTIIHTFQGYPNDAAAPIGGVVQASDGNLYGATTIGGANNAGAIFQLTTTGVSQVVYSSPSGSSISPRYVPLQHTSGVFYGADASGGANHFGEVFSFDMGLPPFCTFVRPIGKVGTTAQILGQGFKGATGVTFNGVPAVTLQVVSDTYITAIVPVGATTGPVVVSTVAGPLASNKNFTVR